MNKYKALKVKGRRIDEHRYLMEQFIGRKLLFDECVHHKDGDKSNNAMDNLEIMSRSDHHKLHMQERIDKGGISEETRQKFVLNGRKTRPNAKLTEEMALKIREALETKPIMVVAREFGISKKISSDIKHRRTWNWI